MKRLTIKDIARELGMHHSTVSRALRSSPEINADTIDRVVNYATQQGYHVNRNALNLRGAGSNIIGVIVPNIYHSFFSNFVSIVTRLAFSAGYIVAVFQSEESLEQEKEIIKSIIQQNIAGVISSLSMETTEVSHFQQLAQYKIPLVCFDRIHPTLERSTVVLDNETTLKNVVAKLNIKGYSKIAYLSGNPAINLFQKRQEGYYCGLEEIKLSYQKCVVITQGFTIDQGFKTTKELIEGDIMPDAIIFDSHILAWGGLSYLKSSNERLLDTFGIASFGGDPWLSIAVPNIVSIQQPEERMAKASFDLLAKAIRNPSNTEIKAVKLQAKIV
jgi:LacI family transcriptional regulator